MTPTDILTWARKPGDDTLRKVVKRAAQATGFSSRTIYHWISEGRVPLKSQRWLQFETGGRLRAGNGSAEKMAGKKQGKAS